VEVVESFVYLGSLIHCSGGSELEIKRRDAFVRDAMFTLDQIICLAGDGIFLAWVMQALISNTIF